MPKILDERVKALMRQGKSESQAYAIATATLQKEGKLKKGSQEPTKKARRK